MENIQSIIEVTEQYGARNYNPLPIVIAKAEGVWVEDIEGKKYLDMLSCYSALNQGHCHPRIVKALVEQAQKVTLTSRAFHNDQLGRLCQMICQLTGKEKVLPMNSGAEAVETAIKAARKWAYNVKKVQENKAEIIVCSDNFHGRTMAAVSMSTEPAYKQGFGPFLPGFVPIPYGNLAALRAAITKNTAALIIEPIQGEAGIILPPEGYLREAFELCREKEVLFIADEIQTGLGRTGKLFACDWEGVVPDIYVLGKALGGGVYPVSAIAGDRSVMELFTEGSHGSTFGGNPLACAVAISSLQVIVDEKLPQRSQELGAYFIDKLRTLNNPAILDIRGRGLFVGVELEGKARPYCEKLMENGVLCKETHSTVIRFAPPLVIDHKTIDWAFERIKSVLGNQG